nr:hypothetical protein [Tanacetum cinerariifolium]
MSTSTHPIIILFDFDVEDDFSSTDYTLALPDYSPASPGNTSSDFKTDSTIITIISSPGLCPKEIMPPQKRAHFLSPPSSLTNISTLPWIEYGIEGLVDGRVIIQQDFDRLKTKLQEARTQIAGFQRDQIKHNDEIILTSVRISTLEILIEDIQDIKHIILPTPTRDTEPHVGSPIPSSSSLLVGSSSPVRSTTPPPDYPFDESIFAKIDNSLWIIPRPLKSKPVLEEPNESDAC